MGIMLKVMRLLGLLIVVYMCDKYFYIETAADDVLLADVEADNKYYCLTMLDDKYYSMKTSSYMSHYSKTMLPELRRYWGKNNDVCGWINIDGVGVNYPVMYREGDNDYYLCHNLEGEEDINGLPILDKRCSPDRDNVNTLIHGHNMRSGEIFGNLDEYVSRYYCELHPVIEFKTLYDTHKFEIFAVCKSAVYGSECDFPYYNYINISEKECFDEYVSLAKEYSLYDTGIDAVWGDRIITLSTCEYSQKNGRLLVIGRECDEE